MTTEPTIRGEILRNGRIKNSLTLEEVARKLDVHRSTVMRWEKGIITHINFSILRELAKLYKISVTQISDCDEGIDGNSNASLESLLSKDEIAIIMAYRNACEAQKNCIKLYAENLSGKVS